MPRTRPPFHLAFPVRDLDEARAFYLGALGCREGRSDDTWVDFDLYGHQIVAHLVPHHHVTAHHNTVEEQDVPVPHFGIVFGMAEWRVLAQRLREAGVRFVIEPRIRFEGRPGEQATLFVKDPSGNALEFKAFADLNQLFAK